MKMTFVGFFDKCVKKEYEKARDENPQLFTFLERATNDLKKNPLCGIKIPKDFWPKEYIKKYNIDNLWKYDLPNGLILIYTIDRESEVRLLSIILKFFNHKNYERRFGN